VRLLGVVEARMLRQGLGSAEKLYRELIEPYEPAPALLARHFQDLARLYLELEAWERVRDAQMEDRWQQSDIKRRRRFHEMDQDLRGTARENFDTGLCRLENSPAKFRKQAECLGLLKRHLAGRKFDLKPVLQLLYGKELDPPSDRAQTICLRSKKLMSPETRPAVTKSQFEDLLDLVEREEQDALTAYGLRLDEQTMTRAACLARLGPRHGRDRLMSLQGERLRQAIDRKQWVINGLLQTPGMVRTEAPGGGVSALLRKTPPPPPKNDQNEANKSTAKRAKNEAKRSQIRKIRPAAIK
jgi:hypothetical protein